MGYISVVKRTYKLTFRAWGLRMRVMDQKYLVWDRNTVAAARLSLALLKDSRRDSRQSINGIESVQRVGIPAERWDCRWRTPCGRNLPRRDGSMHLPSSLAYTVASLYHINIPDRHRRRVLYTRHLSNCIFGMMQRSWIRGTLVPVFDAPISSRCMTIFEY
jgi:hypothetical protein